MANNTKNEKETTKQRQLSPRRAGRNDDVEMKLARTEHKLQQTELLLSVTQKIAGLGNLSEILWTLIEMTTKELKADRGSLFLNDALTGELYSRVAQGTLTREIRILNTAGIAGAVVGGAVGTGGLMACAVAAGPAAPGCIVLFPFLSLLGAGVGGNAGAKPVYFIIVGDDVNGKEIRQDFKMTVWRSGSGMAKKMSKKLKKFTGLKQGEQKV